MIKIVQQQTINIVMRYREIIALAEDETITAWVNINALPEGENKLALAAFAKLAQDQRGEPEAMGAAGGDGNVGIHHATGHLRWLTEQRRRLSRTAWPRPRTIKDCGFDYVGGRSTARCAPRGTATG